MSGANSAGAGPLNTGGKKEEEEQQAIPFQGLEKGLVLQEKRIFSETPLNTRKCATLLTKVLYLLSQGDKLTSTEATDLFFAITKLFQSKDIPLRRLVFLTLKELTSIADSTIMVIASLTKDITGKVDVYRSNAIRVLTGIVDGPVLAQTERYLKAALVDKDPAVVGGAACGLPPGGGEHRARRRGEALGVRARRGDEEPARHAAVPRAGRARPPPRPRPTGAGQAGAGAGPRSAALGARVGHAVPAGGPHAARA